MPPLRISRLAAKWILACTALGLLALPAIPAGAGPLDDARLRAERRHDHGRARGLRADLPEGSRALVRSAVMMDRLRMDASFPAPGSDATDREDRRDHRSSAGRIRGGSERIDLRSVRAGFPDGQLGSPSSPIPEPSSVLMLAAGAGLVVFVIRRKYAKVE
jgi:hypothetical protein